MLVRAVPPAVSMAAIATNTTTNTGSATVANYPVCNRGDLMVLACANSTGFPYTAPSGWSVIGNSNDTGVSTAKDIGVGLFVKTSLGSETGSISVATATASAATAAHIGIIATYAMGNNASLSTPSGGVKISNATYSTTLGHNSFTTSPGVNDMVIHLYGYANHTAGQTYTFAGPASGAWTTRASVTGSGVSLIPTLFLCDKLGGSDVPVATSSVSGSWVNPAFSIPRLGVIQQFMVEQATSSVHVRATW